MVGLITDPFVVQLGVVQQDRTHVGIKFHHHTNIPKADDGKKKKKKKHL